MGDKIVLDNITQDWFANALYTNPSTVFKFFDQLSEERFSIGQVGISAQELQNWKKYRLLGPEKEKDGKRAKNRFSFFEYCWLRLVKILREQSLTFEDILAIRKELFVLPDDLFTEELNKGMHQLRSNVSTPEAMAVLEILDAQMDEIATILKKFEDEINLFFFMILGLILVKPSEAIMIFKGRNLIPDKNGIKGKERKVEVSVFYKQAGKENEWINTLMPFFQDYFTSVNLITILSEFYDNKKISAADQASIFLLTDKEKRVYELIRKEGVKEIKLRFGDKGKGIILIEVKESKSVDAMKQKVSRLLSGDKFKDVNIKIENNNLVLFEETTKIKP